MITIKISRAVFEELWMSIYDTCDGREDPEHTRVADALVRANDASSRQAKQVELALDLDLAEWLADRIDFDAGVTSKWQCPRDFYLTFEGQGLKRGMIATYNKLSAAIGEEQS